MESKRYRLKKDLPDSNAGDEYVLFRDGIEGPSVYYKFGDPNESYWLQKHVENRPDWFELIEEIRPTGTKEVFIWDEKLIAEYCNIFQWSTPENMQEFKDRIISEKQSLKPDSKESKKMIRFSKEASDFIQMTFNLADNWYWTDFYFRKVGDCSYELCDAEKLPADIKKLIRPKIYTQQQYNEAIESERNRIIDFLKDKNV